ncbi:5-formyltetrahydrofolate cyclo-ligase [Candidatus Sodalis sp. SoCistrobi]|uniref:5-formyltetrahydrofolate cyclo-ligase n=1 Tax=Candidatus Sodalis sp. SoCistrobi TaxID=1922216 RepID=UPI00093B138C|nr:5-formyltetrahydrofolate cyclo-ligase [Candidatus Sodalis sp. SoCistrobi]
MTWSMEKSLLRQSLRNQIRQRRRALSPQQQTAAARRVVSHVMNDPRIHSARTLAVFLSFDGELDTRPLIDALWTAGKLVYLPVLHPFTPGHLLFMRYTAATPLVLNRLRIREPQLDITTLLPLAGLDILFTPLVAFDSQGQRLGMGGGFYDRTLQHWRPRAGFYPIGLAHDCQQVAEPLPVEQWDIGLPEIITPSRHWRWHDAGVKKNG